MRGRIFILLFLLIGKSFSQDLSDNLLLYYSFNNNVLDYSGNYYNGVSSGVSFVADRHGNDHSAVYFDGIDDYINFPNIIELKPNLPISFSFWIKYDDLTYENSTVFNTSFEEDVNSGVYMNIQSSTGKYQISYGDGSNSYSSSTRRTFTSNSIIDPNNWHHIAIVVNSQNDMKIYVDCANNNGSYSGTGGSLQYSGFPGVLGRHDRSLSNPADYFKGAIDDFRYWDRSLTEQEIDILCNDRLNIDNYTIGSDVSVKVFPNPSVSGKFNIETNYNNFTKVEVYNTLGNLVFKSNYKSQIDLSQLSKGMYYLSIYGVEKSVNKKIIIN